MSKNTKTNQYWQDFYDKSAQVKYLSYPSQFAAFVYGEMGEVRNVIEFGCGNGRDSFFFARHGKRVCAFDGAESAIRANQANCIGYQREPAFEIFNVDKEFPGLPKDIGGEKCIYARFFIHALRDEQIRRFFEICRSLLSEGEKLYLEYRTVQDLRGAKETEDHYRNYLDSNDVLELLADLGFVCHYNIEGRGFAKWGDDDAFVARHVLVRAHD